MALSALPKSLHSDPSTNLYDGFGAMDLGLTGIILKLDQDRVVKVPKVYDLGRFTGDNRVHMEFVNSNNRESLLIEKSLYERLGNHKGIITCFKASENGIELAFAKQGNLEKYIEGNPEPTESLKAKWILPLADVFTYVHSRRVFVDDIALRNILVDDGELKLVDFGGSCLLPLTADVDTISDHRLTAKLDILHLGWILYSITVWAVHKYSYFDSEDPQWPKGEDLPLVDELFCGTVIKKCWTGGYINMAALHRDACALLAR
jgi:serine/threonine protein kinase